jgi:type VI secretion system protein ImpG
MKSLLPYYERELGLLRERSLDFGRQYPKIASALGVSSEGVRDPHVERMIESFALLSSRIHKKIDDDFPLFTESLLEVLYPNYLRPFPSCAIAQFVVGDSSKQMSKGVLLPKGSAVTSPPIRGVVCKFTTSHDVVLTPVRIAEANFRNSVSDLSGVRLPKGVTSVFSITFELLAPQADWSVFLSDGVRVFIDAEPSMSCLVREVLCSKARAVFVQNGGADSICPVALSDEYSDLLPRLSGLSVDDSLLSEDGRTCSAYRLLTEYFAYPETFNFVDLPLPIRKINAALMASCGSRVIGPEAIRKLTLHIAIEGVRVDSDESRMLESLQARHIALGCVPIVNLFKQGAEPIRLSGAVSGYPVLVDARRPYGFEVYSVDKVYRVRQSIAGEQVEEFCPFFSIRHDQWFDGGDESGGSSASDGLEGRYGANASEGRRICYWHLQRDEDVANTSPGYECEISLVDGDFAGGEPVVDSLSLNVTATNRDLPSQLPFGTPGGDLFMEGGGPAKEIRLVRKPTSTFRFERGRGALWRLISHLSLNHLSLSEGGIDALKEMLRLYDLPRNASNRRQIDGLVAIDYKPATAWLQGEPYATFVRGTEIRLTVDEDSFVGTGLGLFAAVLDHFFALYVHANSFTKLTVISARTQEELISCPPRNGDKPLV